MGPLIIRFKRRRGRGNSPALPVFLRLFKGCSMGVTAGGGGSRPQSSSGMSEADPSMDEGVELK